MENNKKNLEERVKELQLLFKQEGTTEPVEKAVMALLMHMFREYASLAVKYTEIVDELIKEEGGRDEWESSAVG